MTLHLHHLKGCAPVPLAGYLKSLGLLRIVHEQADDKVRGWWQDEHFCLLSALPREELENFFLRSYEPTPLLSPWNRGSGFFGEADPGLGPLESSTAPRFDRFRQGIRAARMLLDRMAHADAVVRAIKDRTKTNRAFQSEEQRNLLAQSEVFQAQLGMLRNQRDTASPGSKAMEDAKLAMGTLELLVSAASAPPNKGEAAALKASAGYRALLAAADRHFKSLKSALLPDCQRVWRGPHAEWLSAAVVLDENGVPQWPSLLGTGGNDGNLDFTNNFMQRLGELLDVASPDGAPLPNSADLLRDSLWAQPSNGLACTAVGQFLPGSAGGANSSTGTLGNPLVNAWDFVLMMEGAIFFSARATRRLDPAESAGASAPFAIRSQTVGYASTGAEKAQRGEQWMPIWPQPATASEVARLFGEAKLQLDRRTVTRPIDAARAISRLGVARGIRAFSRYGYLERNGQATLAVPLGQVEVRERPHAYLVDDLAGWLDRLHRSARDAHAPARLVHAEKRLADAVFAALTHDSTAERWQAVLLAAVAVEDIQAGGTAIETGLIPELSPEWIPATWDNTPAFRLALALGSAAAAYTREGTPIDPVRHHWLPLERGARRFKVSDRRLAKDVRVVAHGRDPLADCASVVDRRLTEAGMKGQRRLPLVAATGCAASLADVASFVEGATNPGKVLGLARAFMSVRWRSWSGPGGTPSSRSGNVPDEAWLALRLASLPWSLTKGHDIPAEPTMVRRLLAGDGNTAVSIALARLRSSGIRPPLQAGFADTDTALRWAAALVFPIDHGSAWSAATILDPGLKGASHA